MQASRVINYSLVVVVAPHRGSLLQVLLVLAVSQLDLQFVHTLFEVADLRYLDTDILTVDLVEEVDRVISISRYSAMHFLDDLVHCIHLLEHVI